MQRRERNERLTRKGMCIYLSFIVIFLFIRYTAFCVGKDSKDSEIILNPWRMKESVATFATSRLSRHD